MCCRPTCGQWPTGHLTPLGVQGVCSQGSWVLPVLVQATHPALGFKLHYPNEGSLSTSASTFQGAQMAATCSTGKSRAKIQASSPGSLIWFSGQVLRGVRKRRKGGRAGNMRKAEGLLSALKPFGQTKWTQPESIEWKATLARPAPHSQREAYRSPAQGKGSTFTTSSKIVLYFIRYLWPPLGDGAGLLLTLTHMKRVHIKVSFCLRRNSIFF